MEANCVFAFVGDTARRVEDEETKMEQDECDDGDNGAIATMDRTRRPG